MKKRIVISAISIRAGGMLAILQDCLKELSDPAYDEYEIYALVKDPKLVAQSNNKVTYRQIDGTRSYSFRLKNEYRYFKKISEELKPFLWLSLHDMTPTVKAERRAVYCHNPTPFYKISFREMKIEPKFAFFNFFYLFLYSINIRKNDYVIVQQQWLRNEFARRFNVPSSKIIVARPDDSPVPRDYVPARTLVKTFLYPSLSRVWKNMEVMCEAAAILNNKGVRDFEVLLTLKGDEDKYSRQLKEKYGHIPQVKFIGLQSREKIFQLYAESAALIFPSRLESWGMPISEYKGFKKPMLLADLPYAHETMGNYDKVSFFNPDDPAKLAGLMEKVMDGNIRFDGNKLQPIAEPLAMNWRELFNKLLK
jgi:glycosyltransferase involved in cell wall biosynthesis